MRPIVSSIESFMDELAAAAGKNPYDFRLRQLADEAAAEDVCSSSLPTVQDGARRPRAAITGSR